MAIEEQRSYLAPSTFQEWLDCFEYMKSNSLEQEYFNQIIRGTFDFDEITKSRFENNLVETINFLLKKYTQRFSRDLNQTLELGELADLPSLFSKFKKDASSLLFFNQLAFVRFETKEQLSQNLKNIITEYWHEVFYFLSKQSIESNCDDLEDALFLIKRITLFSD